MEKIEYTLTFADNEYGVVSCDSYYCLCRQLVIQE